MAYINEAKKTQTDPNRGDNCYTIRIMQTEKGKDYAKFKVRCNQEGTKFNGGYNVSTQYKTGDTWHKIVVESGCDKASDNGLEMICWGFPSVSSWRPSGYGYYLTDGNKRVDLGTHLNPNFADKLAGYMTGTTLTSKEYTVNISRGNNRIGYKDVHARIEGPGNHLPTVEVSLKLETSKIPDVSVTNFSVSQTDNIYAKERFIFVRVALVNPEDYYTLRVKHEGTEIHSSNGTSFSLDIPITREMFNTSQSFTAIVTGKDGVEYYNKTTSLQILPGGIGVYAKTDDKIRDIAEVYYKDKEGNIHEVREVWVKRKSQVTKTIK